MQKDRSQRLVDADDPEVLKCLLETTVHEVRDAYIGAR